MPERVLMKWFHRHTFDPSKWVLICDIAVTGNDFEGISYTKRYEKTYTNTCIDCGDLVSRKIKL